MPALDKLELEHINGRDWRITQAFRFQIDLGELKGVITVPVGFVTDFASIPKALWNILPPTGGYDEAAVVHDYLYVTGGSVPAWPDHIFTKKEADKIFLYAMQDLQVPWYQRYVMYQAVRWFGRGSF